MASDYQENKKNRIGVYYAANGVRHALETEINMRVHIIIMLMVVLFGFILGVSKLEWVSLLITIGMVLTAEMFNTAVEHIMDYLAPERNEAVGRIKDLTAGAVLVTSVIALLVGIIIFLPKIIVMF
ncbi:undecaprenol kinase/diacylglycerol kinase (ATP) [Natronobacillus azotifigens]|uniref:Diacylglycerol kinase family protein n=1 Tax=Natronobacillus azotifigens TaxID=472978 RepID=A0A9J6RF12_9BACI|nr:diacylglycerol kinase family protein [Natronobacillus azotifigens]MCZ0704029.1 diacylglycerol kinase family protein [Natronobacillus azotifigens]